MNTTRLLSSALGASVVVVGAALGAPMAFADPADPAVPGPVPAPSVIQVGAAPTSDNAQPAAVQACATFSQVLDGSAQYYGDFADSLEGSNYNDPAVSTSGQTGRTALRQAAGTAMDAANTPGLAPEISEPMRSWAGGATTMLVKMAVHISGQGLDTTAAAMNTNAEKVQTACAAAGTHA